MQFLDEIFQENKLAYILETNNIQNLDKSEVVVKQNYAILSCSQCNTQLGIQLQTKNKNYLIKDRVNLRESQQTKVNLASLKQDIIDQTLKQLEQYIKSQNNLCQVSFSSQILTKRDLLNYQANQKQNNQKQNELTIIVHKCEGRILLTDNNGIYDSFIRHQICQNYGRVILVLINVDQKQNETIVDELINQAGQKSLQYFKLNNLIYVCKDQMSKNALEQIIDLFAKQYTGGFKPLNLEQYFEIRSLFSDLKQSEIKQLLKQQQTQLQNKTFQFEDNVNFSKIGAQHLNQTLAQNLNSTIKNPYMNDTQLAFNNTSSNVINSNLLMQQSSLYMTQQQRDEMKFTSLIQQQNTSQSRGYESDSQQSETVQQSKNKNKPEPFRLSNQEEVKKGKKKRNRLSRRWRCNIVQRG